MKSKTIAAIALLNLPVSMQVAFLIGASAVLGSTSVASAASHAGYVAAVGGPIPAGGVYVVDRYNFFKGECTSYCAFRLNNIGFPFKNQYLGRHFSHGKTWVAAANAAGLTVNTTAAPNAVLCSTSGTYGHVAFVDSVSSDGRANISEYNYSNTHQYTTRSGIVANGTTTFFIHFTKPPVITSTSVFASNGAITVTGATSDPDGDPIMQLDLWLIDATTGIAVPDTMGVSLKQGTFTPSSFRKVWTADYLATRITKSGKYKVGLRSIDTHWAQVEATSTTFQYDRPLPSAPEIAIVQNGTSRPSGGNAALLRTQLNTTRSATLTVQNTGKSDLKISSCSTTNSRFSASLSTTTIKPGYSGTITVRFTPNATGYTYGTLAIRNNDADESRYLINLAGYGTR